MGNNKTSSAPAPPAPPTFRLFFEVFSVGPEGFVGSIEAFGGRVRDVPADSGPVLVAEGIAEGADSQALGTGFNMLGDPGMFSVEGATFDALEFMGNEWSCVIHSVTGDITVRLPVGMMEGPP